MIDSKYRWLNQDSLDFLKQGYLKEDETLPERV